MPHVINWNNFDSSSTRHAFDSAMCKAHKVKFQPLDCIYDFTNQRDTSLRCKGVRCWRLSLTSSKITSRSQLLTSPITLYYNSITTDLVAVYIRYSQVT